MKTDSGWNISLALKHSAPQNRTWFTTWRRGAHGSVGTAALRCYIRSMAAESAAGRFDEVHDDREVHEPPHERPRDDAGTHDDAGTRQDVRPVDR
jgi:hypothetical protein